jgi:hypothetical protein
MFSLSGRTTSMRYLRQRKQEIPMRKKLIAALSLLGVGGAFALALAVSAPASTADTTYDALACKLIRLGDKYHTICR